MCYPTVTTYSPQAFLEQFLHSKYLLSVGVVVHGLLRQNNAGFFTVRSAPRNPTIVHAFLLYAGRGRAQLFMRHAA